VVAILQRHEGADCVRFRLHPHVEERAIRASRGQPARVEQVRDTTVEVEVDEAALGVATRRLGWTVRYQSRGRAALT
jgi:hypothetical protein